MNKRQIRTLLGLVFLLGIVSGCKRNLWSNETNNIPPPPIGTNIGPNGPKNLQGSNGNGMRKKLDAICISGIMQTGSNIFKELKKNGGEKLTKLKIIKEKLQYIDKNTQDKNSRTQINNQMKVIDEMILEMENNENEVTNNPNNICNQIERLENLNKSIKERIMGVSEGINTIREREKKEGLFRRTFERIKENFLPDQQNQYIKCEESKMYGDKKFLGCPALKPGNSSSGRDEAKPVK